MKHILNSANISMLKFDENTFFPPLLPMIPIEIYDAIEIYCVLKMLFFQIKLVA